MAINVLTATGNVGNDAELRYLQNGTAVAEFNLPVKQGYGDNQKTAWIKCVIWGKLAELIAPSIKKGDLAMVSGEFYVDEWEKDGVKHSKPCLRVSQIQTSKKQESQPQQAQQGKPSNPSMREDIPMDFDDDVPF